MMRMRPSVSSAFNLNCCLLYTSEEAQKQVDSWIKEYGVRYFSELTNMAILTEEVKTKFNIQTTSVLGAVHKDAVRYQLAVVLVGRHHVGGDALPSGFGGKGAYHVDVYKRQE